MACFAALIPLPCLRGPHVVQFLAYFTLADLAYLFAVLRLKGDPISLRMLWMFALLFRLALLLTSPSLFDDVYRYAWDGRLLNQGINPYALPVDTPQLDAYATPLRGPVNHA